MDAPTEAELQNAQRATLTHWTIDEYCHTLITTHPVDLGRASASVGPVGSKSGHPTGSVSTPLDQSIDVELACTERSLRERCERLRVQHQVCDQVVQETVLSILQELNGGDGGMQFYGGLA
jgi:hypothetical protein